MIHVQTPWQRLLVARGGRGGRGNEAFKTDRNSAPKMSERGEVRGERWLQVELKLVRGITRSFSQRYLTDTVMFSVFPGSGCRLRGRTECWQEHLAGSSEQCQA